MLLDKVLIIFLKYPEAGFVKTRLAKEIGGERAACLYRVFAETILARTDDTGFTRFIFYSPPEKRSEMINWLGPGLDIHPQNGDDLGERLSNAFEFAFKKGAKRVVAIGSDSPTIDKEVILRAFKELEDKGCVIGPSADGGYYLLGLSSFYGEVFRGITWSTKDVLKQTLNIIKSLRLKFSLLDEHLDIDTWDDLKRIIRDTSHFSPLDKNRKNGMCPSISQDDQ